MVLPVTNNPTPNKTSINPIAIGSSQYSISFLKLHCAPSYIA
ncbi:hypothetical protein PF010_g1690 [Phytophthora fragariae]|uniref:Uncharacterized protein n=1 Tax=Phytophthora fragariae TaxID=53985 RepID=A0A6G0LZ97_9STRA|nr:hypothetical protein PF003_g1235 [Phytophthora fragariae]KAE9136447.1 hypothetical protein PF010_g1690 [Phytophthora fragariae]